MQKSNFRDWILEKIESEFGIVQVKELQTLNDWLGYDYSIDDFETRYLNLLKENFIEYGGDDWNEFESFSKIISSIIVFSGIQNKKFSYFLKRELSVITNDYELSGLIDGIIATGFRNPKMPLFCLNQYKKESDPFGEPRGQLLATMLAVQKNNNNQHPIFGCYIIGRSWNFVVLEGSKYSISKDFSCGNDKIFDIFRILKSLRVQIEKII
jgi:hypothetical protein